MKMILVLLMVGALLYWLFHYFLQQSKKPTGIVGSWMMRLWNRVYLPLTKWCLSLLPEKDYPHVLDIGVGNGASTNYISQTLACTSVTGIDSSDRAIENANTSRLPSKLLFEKKDICETNYPSQKFDLICAFQNHFHWNDLEESLLEVKRMLTPDGIFIIGCEYAKLTYFLPDLAATKNFENYLAALALTLVRTERKKTWIFYQITKKSA